MKKKETDQGKILHMFCATKINKLDTFQFKCHVYLLLRICVSSSHKANVYFDTYRTPSTFQKFSQKQHMCKGLM